MISVKFPNVKSRYIKLDVNTQGDGLKGFRLRVTVGEGEQQVFGH